jgi:ATPase family AAA domain-containing protein 3A/B
MALRSAVARYGRGIGLAAGLVAASGTYALCEKDVRAPSFDPEALERGAKALREINASPNAKKVRPAQVRSARVLQRSAAAFLFY